LAKVLVHLGAQHCFIVHGMDGLDEMTVTDRTRVSEGKAGVVSSYWVDPGTFGIPRAHPKDLAGGTPDDNARILREILRGKKGPKRDVACLNAAPALVAARKASTLEEGYQLAGRILDSGAAMERLEQLIAFTNRGTA
jgi:anthranilate phosphoribosyltransferase